MSHSSSSNLIVAACPNCARTYRLPPERIGRKAKCATCETVFRIEALAAAVPTEAVAVGQEAAEAPPSAPKAPLDSRVGVCPVCRSEAEGAQVECPDCHARHHQECWEYNGGCGKYGCPSAPEPQKLDEMEVPLAYWGKTEKECPACRNMIQAAALRCRHCGMVFASARPQGAGEFHAQRALESDLPGLRRKAIFLLVFSILPCTTTIALIGGGFWYAANRKRLAALPAQQAALAKIGLVIGVVQTALLILVLVLHQFLGT